MPVRFPLMHQYTAVPKITEDNLSVDLTGLRARFSLAVHCLWSPAMVPDNPRNVHVL